MSNTDVPCRWGRCNGTIVNGKCARCGAVPPPPRPALRVQRETALGFCRQIKIAVTALEAAFQATDGLFPDEDAKGEEYDAGAEHHINKIWDTADVLIARLERVLKEPS